MDQADHATLFSLSFSVSMDVVIWKEKRKANIECSHGGDPKNEGTVLYFFSWPRSRKALHEKRKSRRRGNAKRTGNASRDYQNYNSAVS
jgi:hypothetical protein